MKRPYRLGLVGLGHVAKPQIKALQLQNNFSLVAGYDIDSTKSGLLPEGASFYTHLDQLSQDAEIDCVLISVPNQAHYPLARWMLAQGKHVLLEKPATTCLRDLLDLLQLAAQHKVKLVVALHAAFGLETLWFLANRSALGPIVAGPLTGFHSEFYDPYVLNGRLLDQACSLEGSWMDSGINALSVIRHFVDPELQKIVPELSYLVEMSGTACLDVQSRICVEFPANGNGEGARGFIETNWTRGQNLKTTYLQFASRQVLLHHSQQCVYISSNQQPGHQPWQLLVDCSQGRDRLVNHYLGVYEDFFTCLETGSDNLDLSITLHRLLFEPYLSGVPRFPLRPDSYADSKSFVPWLHAG